MSHVLGWKPQIWRCHSPSASQHLSLWLARGSFSLCLHIVVICVYVPKPSSYKGIGMWKKTPSPTFHIATSGKERHCLQMHHILKGGVLSVGILRRMISSPCQLFWESCQLMWPQFPITGGCLKTMFFSGLLRPSGGVHLVLLSLGVSLLPPPWARWALRCQ